MMLGRGGQQGVWDKAAHYYDKYVTKSKYDRLILYKTGERERLFRFIRASIQPDDEVCLIDVGCGTGRLLVDTVQSFIVNENDRRVRALIGVDNSDAMIARAQRRVQSEIKDAYARGLVQVINGDARTLSEDISHKMDVYTVRNSRKIVFCMLNTLGVFRDENDRRAVIAEMAKTAGSGGHIFLSFFNAASFAKEAPPLYSGLMKIVGSFDPNTYPFAQTVDFANRDYYSHWFQTSEATDLVKAALAQTPLAGSTPTATPINSIAFTVQV